jgi:RNA polymerase sigma-70 factor (ECF subfamily)
MAAGGVTDDELVAAVRAGDERAFGELLLRHESPVLRILRLLGVPASDREDLAQDVFLRAFRYLASYRAGRSFAAWLYRIVVNETHDWRRERAARGHEEAGWSVAAEAAIDPAPLPDRGFEPTLRRRLESALGALSERERAVFVLCEIEGLSTLDVARALGITRITVRRHLGLARRRLTRILAEEENEEKRDAVDRSSVRVGSS